MAPVVLESRRFLVMEQVSWFVYRVSVTSGRVVYGAHSVVIAFLGPPCSPARCSPPSPSFFLLLPPSTVSFAPSSGGSARYAVPIFFSLLSVVPFASDELPGPRLATTRLYTHYMSSGASTGGSPHHPARRVLRPRLRLYYFSLPIYFLGAPDRGPPTTRPTGFPSVSPPQYYRAPTARQ